MARLSPSSGKAVDSHSELPSSAGEGVVEIELSIVPPRTTPESTDGALAMVALGQHSESPSNDGNDNATMHQRRSLVFLMMTLMSIAGMGTATVGVLAGGKVGFCLSRSVSNMVAFGMIDSAVISNKCPSQEDRRSSTSAVLLRNVAWKRGTCWLAIGLLQATVNALYLISIDTKRMGTVWQRRPLLYMTVDLFICKTGLVAGVMMRAHRDRISNVFKWLSSSKQE